MKDAFVVRKIAGAAGWLRLARLAVIVLVLASAASAVPVTYTGFTIASGQLGAWQFKNARVYLRFKSDTNNVQFIQFPDPFGTTVDTWYNPTGAASVTIVGGGRRVHANFADNQIFVALDLGNTPGPQDPPLVGGRGVGFGSFTATGIEPAYPLGIEDGTIDFGDGASVSPELAGLSLDLMHNTGFSGRAWQCVGFPTGGLPCSAPNPLKTDKGDLVLFQPYQQIFPDLSYGDSLSGGVFFAVVDAETDEDDTVEDSAPAAMAVSGQAATQPIRYHGFLISDVTIGSHHYTGARIYLSFDADKSTVRPFTSGTSSGYVNRVGTAHVRVVSGHEVIAADFAPNQIYVYFDVAHSSIGFGSYAGGPGYPLSVTANEEPNTGLTENSSIGAISDILRTPANAVNYTPETATLFSGLRRPTTLSGAASSCVAFDPATSVCSDFTPVRLETSEGGFYLFEPYTDDESIGGTQRFSVNWGLFWAR